MQDPPPQLCLARQGPVCNTVRYYTLEVAADLLRGTVLIRSRGRIDRQGQQRRLGYPPPTEAALAQNDWRQRKLRRWYLPCT